MSRRPFIVAAMAGAALCLVFLLILTTGMLGHSGTVVADDYLCALVPLGAGLLCLRTDHSRPPATSRGWLYLGVSCLLWGGGGAVWTVYEVHLGVDAPFPSLADAGYLTAVPFAVLGLVRMPGARITALGGVRTVMDGALAAGALAFLSWATVLGPIVRDGQGTLFSRGIALAYPLSDVVIATMAILVVARARGDGWPAIVMIAAGQLAVAISDSSFAWFTAHGQYATGNLFDLGYVAGYTLIALAALRCDPRSSIEDSPDVPGTATLFLPYVPLAANAAMCMGLRLRDQPIDGFLFWDGLALVTLVLGRQLLGLIANVSLSRELHDSLKVVQQREAELQHQAFHDPLTGLANRALFAQQLHDALAAGAAEPVIVMLLDLDNFKVVNDSHGHDTGDRLLIIISERLRTAVRPADSVARLGGDEFAVLLGQACTLVDAHLIADRILSTLRHPADLEEATVHPQGSLGIAYAHPGDDAADLMRHADIAMYQAKRRGKGQAVTHHADQLPHDTPCCIAEHDTMTQ
jgi:diguanylate cyclase (GGDEF)-like protein